MSLIKDLQNYFNINNELKTSSSKKSINNFNLNNSIISDLEEEDDDIYINNNNNNTKEVKLNNNNNLLYNPITLNLIQEQETPKYNRYNINDNYQEDYNEIIKDFLYISGYKTASTLSDLQKLKITNIINCSGDLCDNLSKDDEYGIKYLTLNIRDNVSENIECLFFRCINYINEVKGSSTYTLL